MSFMYNPFPYDDPHAVNAISVDEELRSSVRSGLSETVDALVRAALKKREELGRCILSLDGYIGAPLDVLSRQLSRALRVQGVPIQLHDASSLFYGEGLLAEKLLRYLPEDREEDPPLLFGRLFKGGYEELFDPERARTFEAELQAFKDRGDGVLISYGHGCLAPGFRPLSDIRCFLDITQKRAVLSIKGGRVGNLGFSTPAPYNETLRHAYYVDFEVASDLRGSLIREGSLDFYIAADDPDRMQLIPFPSFQGICRALVAYPFRCRPVYIEGVWGGFFIKRLRGLPNSMRNCAWVFDLIPLEVSIVADMGSLQLELPYFCFVQTVGEELMGQTCVRKFGGYFPVRFNYDDTYHASGNMSIQCHPDGPYVREHNGELGRQDESYYIVATGQGAVTYCGFQEDCDVEEFIEACRKSERRGTPIDHDRYVRSEPSAPGKQFLIPAGTIHASGRNQVILEIGSLTVGSYTYKMYDYMRRDLEGNLRPIHSAHGDRVLRRERRGDWVKRNLIPEPRVLRAEDDGVELVVGEHELLYFSLHNLRFQKRMTDDTVDRFHVLVLVDGEKVLVRSLSDPSKYFEQGYLDMIVVPASFGRYELVNLGVGTVVMHKTVLREGYERLEP